MLSANYLNIFTSFSAILALCAVKLERKKVLEGYVLNTNRAEPIAPLPIPVEEEEVADFGNCAIGQAANVVHTMFGPVRGFTAIDGANSSLVDAFLGIPFVQPPIGHLRFEKPRPLMTAWDGILDGTEHKKSCVPHARPDWLGELLQQNTFSEDCLYLNIFAPHGANKWDELLPVLVLIHGGAFSVGSSRQFVDHKDIGTKFVSHGIVVVSVQYRLGVFGFASTGDAQMPGNLGLWDQLAALQFIKQNIRRFGGNPDDVTLLGHSAGAASISGLSASPHSRHLFTRAIQMAGSMYSSFMIGPQVHSVTTELAETVGCEVPIKECLRRKSVNEIHAAIEKMGPAKARFGPRIDGDFFPNDIPSLVDTSPKKPTLIGFTDLEALEFTLLYGQNSTIMALALPWTAINNYGSEQFEDFLLGQIATARRFGPRASALGREIFDFYARSSASLGYSTNAFFIRQYTELLSDLIFNLPIVTEIQHKLSRGWPMHFYVHGHVNEQAFPKEVPIHESFHGNDLNYVFNGSLRQFSFSAQDKQIEDFMVEAFRNFIKKGNPSTSDSFKIHWPRVSCPQQLEHVRIVHPPTLMTNIDRELMKRVLFWRKMARKYTEFELAREMPQKLTVTK
uniref:Carboxylic ester hydrolase n=1 Tax=Globodera rostochiensis TaxID=31243 RepID=A0A914HY51_GLORO